MAETMVIEAATGDVGRFTLVSASAGSGKTFKLVHAFVRELHRAVLAGDHSVVDRVLAATFTRAAAGEMVDRILRRLAEAVCIPGERHKLCEELGCGDLSDGDCEQLLLAVLRRLHRFRIGTVDSFLVAAARAFAPELGLADGWAVLDEASEAELEVAAIDGMLRRLAVAPPEEFAATCDLLVAAGQDRPAAGAGQPPGRGRTRPVGGAGHRVGRDPATDAAAGRRPGRRTDHRPRAACAAHEGENGQ
jgi:ATP-dependent exoDNAse (exonuclease V) beta subunit